MNKKKISIIALLVALLGVTYYYQNKQDTEEPQEGVEQKKEVVVPETALLPRDEAFAVAQESACANEGEVGDLESYNEDTQTWWFALNTTEGECNAACVVDDVLKTARIEWRCDDSVTVKGDSTTARPMGK